GDYLQTENATHPATRWIGTTWIKLEGRVLLGTSSGYALGSQGGATTITLTKANLPNIKLKTDSHLHTKSPHTHYFNVCRDASEGAISGSTKPGGGDPNQYGGTFNVTTSSSDGGNTAAAAPYTEALGNGAAFNVMNPHRTVHIWRRTA
ncbi:MAG: hypothetical protein WBG30_08965, partial [Psychrilyobacter sp.]|uniref:phage baseplate protein n=1 Tax=Psychrilyobacter sp. TaxID=2586924 RepID=UPI003C71A194